MKHSSASLSRGTILKVSLTLGPWVAAMSCTSFSRGVVLWNDWSARTHRCGQVGVAGKQYLCAKEGRSLHSLQKKAWPWLWWAIAKDYPDCKSAAGKRRLQQRNMATPSRVRDIIKKMVILISFAEEGKPASVLGRFCMHTYAKRKISLT